MMHPDQVDLATVTVAGLVASQFPRWRRYDVRPVPSTGTVNALFRLGPDIVLRFPLIPSADEQARGSLLREQENSRLIAPHSPFAVPEPLALGAPDEAYPGWWTAYRWISGDPIGPDNVDDPVRLARDLARFVRVLHGIDTGGRAWNGHSRGGPLNRKADDVRRALAASAGLVDVGAVDRAWQRCLAAPSYPGAAVWLHADLMPGNLLVRDGRLAAVIDLGSMCVGDPAVDLMPAWNVMPAVARAAYRGALGVDDATWERGRGWAIAQAVIALPYYVDTNPAMADTARRTLAAVLR